MEHHPAGYQGDNNTIMNCQSYIQLSYINIWPRLKDRELIHVVLSHDVGPVGQHLPRLNEGRTQGSEDLSQLRSSLLDNGGSVTPLKETVQLQVSEEEAHPSDNV